MAYVGLLSKTSDQRHLRPSSYGYNSSLPPHPPPPPSLCPLCYLPFNQAITGICLNCFYRPPSLSSPSSHQRHLQSNKRSNSSLSSSGSSSSSITSPSELPSDSFIMSSMLGVVDDILREETLQDVPICRHCNQAEPPLLFCLDCKEHLCLYCTPHHQKDHHIVKTHPSFPYKEMSPISPPPTKSLTPSDSCLQHLGGPLLYFCRPCLTTICHKCIDEDHRNHQYATIAESFQKMKPSMDELALAVPQHLSTLNQSSQHLERTRADILRKKNEMSSNIHQIFHQLHEAIRKRELEILASIETITTTRLGSLEKEKDTISLDIKSLSELSSQMKEAKEKEQLAALVMAHCKLGKELERIASNTKQHTIEDESLFAIQNQSSIQTAINDFCKLTTAPYPPLCSASGEGLLHPRVNKPVTVTVFAKDRLGEPCTEGGETLVASLNQKTGGGGGGVTVRDNKDGTYLLSFKPHSCGDQYLSITIRGHHIQGSPFQLLVDGRREYNHFGSVSVVFGSEGSKPGQLCRPWGICADHKGNIIIGDRSNHRIQVFDSNGTFSHTFGSEGSRPGQFNRPAGVAVTKEGDILVADKDNHRIQKFQLNGKLIHYFGSRGSNDGQMVYPYDVSVHQTDGRIVVTDTGNHRILIFTPDGSLLGKFGYKGYLCGHFDSPRGIVMTNEGHIAVSDFNVHHLLVIEPNGTQARILGSHGSGNAQFTRPQGIAIDHMGNIVVADTRNNRIVVMSPCGQFLAKFGSGGKARGQFDRPTSVTVLPDGRIAVLDFGNSRVQIF